MKILNFNLMNLFLLINFLLIMIMIIPSNLFKFHPLTFMLILIIYTIILCLKLNFFYSTYWYSYILFLIMIGGLMILFMYFTSLTNNQLFYFNKNFYFFNLLKFLFLFMIFFYMKKFFEMNFFWMINSIEMNNFFYNFTNKNLILYKNLMMNFSSDMNLYIIMYLFFTMICSILICKKMKIPLRQILKY